MESKILYTDVCCPELITSIKEELGIGVVQRFANESWTVNEAMSIITAPNLILAVMNTIDEVSVMEISLLNFMCKPVLVTAASIDSYPMVEKTVDYVDKNANLKDKDSNFISWFKKIMEERWIRDDYHQIQNELYCG
jgi:hypothetical protein